MRGKSLVWISRTVSRRVYEIGLSREETGLLFGKGTAFERLIGVFKVSDAVDVLVYGGRFRPGRTFRSERRSGPPAIEFLRK